MTPIMMSTETIEAKILEFIQQDVLSADEDAIDRETPLLAWGILDSLSMLSLIDFIEDTFGLEVDPQHMEPSSLENVGVIAQWVSEKALAESGTLNNYSA